MYYFYYPVICSVHTVTARSLSSYMYRPATQLQMTISYQQNHNGIDLCKVFSKKTQPNSTGSFNVVPVTLDKAETRPPVLY